MYCVHQPKTWSLISPANHFVSCLFKWLWEHKRGTSTQNGHFSSHTVSDGSLTVHQHNIALNSFLVKSVILTRQWCHEQVTHYKALSKHISHKVPMETALTYNLLLMGDTHLGVWWNLDSFRPISRLPLSVDTNMKIRGIEWEFPALVLASNKMHKEGLLFLCRPPPIDVHPYTQSKYTKPNVKSQRENFCQQSSCTHSRSLLAHLPPVVNLKLGPLFEVSTERRAPGGTNSPQRKFLSSVESIFTVILQASEFLMPIKSTPIRTGLFLSPRMWFWIIALGRLC